MNKTILVVDDHPLFRKALVGLIQEMGPEFRVLSAASAEEGLRHAREEAISAVLLDLGLPGANGVDAITLFRSLCDAAIVVVSASEQRQEIAAVLRAGACAVVSKCVSMEVLRGVVDQALAGEVPDQRWIRPVGALPVVDDADSGLTSRQQEVATLLLSGHSNKEIGMRLGLAEITVKTHLTAIFRQLGVVNRTQAVVAIRRLGIDHSHRDLVSRV